MYNELVKQCRDCIDCLCGECKYEYLQEPGNFVLCMNALLGEAANAIEKLADRNVGKWIPVAERFPPVEKEVYVTDGEYIARANLLDEVFPGDKPCWSYSGLGEITHWCEQIPLPQPLNEEGET